MNSRAAISVFFLSAFLAEAAVAETLYIQSLKISLRAEPAVSARELGQLSRGDRVKKLESRESWIRVEPDSGKSGWIPAIMASSRAPIQKESMLSGSEDFSKNARKRSSATASAGAARGLREDSADTLLQLKGSDYGAVERLHKNHVLPDRAFDFVKL